LKPNMRWLAPGFIHYKISSCLRPNDKDYKPI
jgi:hypothetical protein